MFDFSLTKYAVFVVTTGLVVTAVEAQSPSPLGEGGASSLATERGVATPFVNGFFYSADTLSNSSCNHAGDDQLLHGCDSITIQCGDPGSQNTPRRGACVLGECIIILPESTCESLSLPAGDYPIDTLRELIDSFPYRSLEDALNACTLSHELQHTSQDPETTSDCAREYEAYLHESNCLLTRFTDNCGGFGTELPPTVCRGLEVASCMRLGAATFHGCRCDNNIGGTSDPVSCPAECRQRCESTVANCLAPLSLLPGYLETLRDRACGEQSAAYCLATE